MKDWATYLSKGSSKMTTCLSETLDGEEEVGLGGLDVHFTSSLLQCQEQLSTESFPQERNTFPLWCLHPNFKDVLDYSEKKKTNGSKREKANDHQLKWKYRQSSFSALQSFLPQAY